MHMNTSTNPAGDTAAVARERVSADLRLLIDDAQRLLADASRYDDAQLAKVKQRLRDEVERIGAQLTDAQSAARDKVRQVAHDTDETVRGNPYAAMGVAAVAGLLVGALLARR